MWSPLYVLGIITVATLMLSASVGGLFEPNSDYESGSWLGWAFVAGSATIGLRASMLGVSITRGNVRVRDSLQTASQVTVQEVDRVDTDLYGGVLTGGLDSHALRVVRFHLGERRVTAWGLTSRPRSAERLGPPVSRRPAKASRPPGARPAPTEASERTAAHRWPLGSPIPNRDSHHSRELEDPEVPARRSVPVGCVRRCGPSFPAAGGVGAAAGALVVRTTDS